MSSTPRVTVVVPVLNEAPRLRACLERLAGQAFEVIVVDGGSSDDSRSIASEMGAVVVDAPRGRASQMNAGAHQSRGDWLLFLHGDTQLPANWLAAIADSERTGKRWGRFDVDLDSQDRWIRMVGFMMNHRSCLSGITTGDQAMFVARAAWQTVGGFPAIALMEDIELSKQLKRTVGRPACRRERVKVSARRWQQHGTWRTIRIMWWLRLQYFFGVSPDVLHARYYGQKARRP